MGALGCFFAGVVDTIIGFVWFYFVMYQWLWLGLVGSTTIGWAIGYFVLFIVFIGLSYLVVCLLFGIIVIAVVGD